MRQYIDIVEGKTFTLFEVLENPYPLQKVDDPNNPMQTYAERTSDFAIYQTMVGTFLYQITMFYYGRAWEVHLHNVTMDYVTDIQNVLTGIQLSRLLASIMELLLPKIRAGQAIRITTPNIAMKKVYDRAIAYVMKREKLDCISMSLRVVGIDGRPAMATVVQLKPEYARSK